MIDQPLIDLRLPKLSTDTPISQAKLSSPIRFQTHSNPYSSRSPRLLSLQRTNKPKLNSTLVSKFFIEDRFTPTPPPIISQTYSTSTPDHSNKWKKQLDRIQSSLIEKELAFNKNTKSDPIAMAQQEFSIYKNHIEEISSCFQEKHLAFSRTIVKSLGNLSRIFIKALTIVSSINKSEVKPEPAVKATVIKTLINGFTQTDLPTDVYPEIDIQNIKGLKEKLMNINMPRITRRLLDIQESLVESRTTVPRTPKTPDISSKSLFDLFKYIQSQSKAIEKIESEVQTDAEPIVTNVLEFNSDEKLQIELYKLRQKYEEEVLKHLVPIEKEETQKVNEIDSSLIIQSLECEIIQLKMKVQQLQVECEIQNKQVKAEIIVETKTLPINPQEIDTGSKQLSIEIEKNKVIINEYKAKISEIEEAWLSRTGNKFVYGGQENPQKRTPKNPVKAISKPEIYFPKSPKAMEIGLKPNRPLRTETRNNGNINSIPPQVAKEQKLPSELKTTENIIQSYLKPPVTPKLPQSLTIISHETNDPPINITFDISNPKLTPVLNQPAVSLSSASKESFNAKEVKSAYKETVESSLASITYEVFDSNSDTIEGRLFKALNPQQWQLFQEYKMIQASLALEKSQTNIRLNSKSCSISSKNSKEKLINIRSSKSNLRATIKPKISEKLLDTDQITTELNEWKSNPIAQNLLSKTFCDKEIEQMPLSLRVDLIKVLKDHAKKRCGEDCEHLRRAMMIKYKSGGKPYPIHKIKLF